jgi:mannosyltransferase OCH1-like enzyme
MILQVVQDKSTLVDALSESVKEYMSNWNYVLLTETEADKFVQQMYPDYWITYSNYKYWEQKRNAVIFLWLYKNGGLYIDINYRMMSSLESKLSLDAELYLMQSPDVETYYTTSLLGGVAQHPLWKSCIEEMRSLAKSPPKWSISKELYISATTGTIMFSSMVSKVSSPYYVLPVSSVAPRNVCGNKTTRDAGVLYQTYSCENPQGMEQWIYGMYVCNPVWLYIIIIILVLLVIWLLIKSIGYFYKSKDVDS